MSAQSTNTTKTPKQKAKKSVWRITLIVVCTLILPIMICNLIVSIKGIANKEQIPSLFGLGVVSDTHGTMESDFKLNDLLFVKSVDTNSLQANEDIICFVKDGKFITHRISRIETVEGVKRFYTIGDAVGIEDDGYVLAEQIQGKYIGKISGLGGVAIFYQTPLCLILTVVLFATLVALIIVESELIKGHAKEVKNMAELQAENERLKAKIIENEQMALTAVPVNAEVVENEDDTAEETIITQTGAGIISKYNRSFMARLIQGGDSIQELYSELKNYVLQYQDVKSRNSWSFETFTNKRNPIVKITIKGKSFFAYFALTDEEIEQLKIDKKVESTSRYSAFPAKIKISGIVKLNRAKKAVDLIAQRLGLTAGELPTVKYSYPFESDKALIEKGLIKLKENAVITEEVAVTSTTPIVENQENLATETGIRIKSPYKRSFAARLIQNGKKVQELYTEIKNHLLTYNEIKCKTFWNSENFTVKNNSILKLTIKGKTLFAYIALNSEDIEKVSVDGFIEKGKYVNNPAKIKITGIVKLNRTKKAVDLIAERLGLTVGEAKTESYIYPFESDKELLARGLVKLNANKE